jgi:hypothetical protein
MMSGRLASPLAALLAAVKYLAASRQAVKRPRIVLDNFSVLRGADAAAVF